LAGEGKQRPSDTGLIARHRLVERLQTLFAVCRLHRAIETRQFPRYRIDDPDIDIAAGRALNEPENIVDMYRLTDNLAADDLLQKLVGIGVTARD